MPLTHSKLSLSFKPIMELSTTYHLAALSIAVTAILFIYRLARNTYRIRYHPLAKFPGPRAAAISKGWLYRVSETGDPEAEFARLHEAYGKLSLFTSHKSVVSLTKAQAVMSFVLLPTNYTCPTLIYTRQSTAKTDAISRRRTFTRLLRVTLASSEPPIQTCTRSSATRWCQPSRGATC